MSTLAHRRAAAVATLGRRGVDAARYSRRARCQCALCGFRGLPASTIRSIAVGADMGARIAKAQLPYVIAPLRAAALVLTTDVRRAIRRLLSSHVVGLKARHRRAGALIVAEEATAGVFARAHDLDAPPSRLARAYADHLDRLAAGPAN